MRYDVVVLGGGLTGVELAAELSENGHVAVVGDEPTVTRARQRGLTAHESTLASASPPIDCTAETVVVATRSDARTLLLATAAPRAFETDRVVALITDPELDAAFADAGIDTVCVPTAVSRAAADAVSRVAPPTSDTPERTSLRE